MDDLTPYYSMRVEAQSKQKNDLLLHLGVHTQVGVGEVGGERVGRRIYFGASSLPPPAHESAAIA